jgi:hypothetical protein
MVAAARRGIAVGAVHDPMAALPCWQQTDSEGHFKTNAIVAGSGKHDFWIVAWKEGYAAQSQRVWRGDGSPSGPVNVSVTLASE